MLTSLTLSSTFISNSLLFGFSTIEFTFGFESAFDSDVSIKQIISPTDIESPSSAFNVILPEASAGRSKVALSESNSAIV